MHDVQFQRQVVNLLNAQKNKINLSLYFNQQSKLNKLLPLLLAAMILETI